MAIAKLLSLLLCITIVTYNCGESSFKKQSYQQMIKKIILKPNEVFTEKVKSLGGAGYSWVVEQNDSLITTVEIKNNTNQKSKAMGAEIEQLITITALKQGTAKITIVQKRIWETEPPLETLNFIVTVKA